MDSKFLERIILDYSKSDVSFFQNNIATIKFFTNDQKYGAKSTIRFLHTIFSLTRGKLDQKVKRITAIVSNLGVRIIRGDKSFYHDFTSKNGKRIIFEKSNTNEM